MGMTVTATKQVVVSFTGLGLAPASLLSHYWARFVARALWRTLEVCAVLGPKTMVGSGTLSQRRGHRRCVELLLETQGSFEAAAQLAPEVWWQQKLSAANLCNVAPLASQDEHSK